MAAAQDPTYGYRRVYHHLCQVGVRIGRECVRQLMGLQPPPPDKKKRLSQPVIAVEDWPEGRRIQIDVTGRHSGRLTLGDFRQKIYPLASLFAALLCCYCGCIASLCALRSA